MTQFGDTKLKVRDVVWGMKAKVRDTVWGHEAKSA